MFLFVIYLFFSEDLLQVFEHDSLHRVDHHPEGGECLANQLLAFLLGVSHVKHDVANDVVVKDKGRLLRQLGNKLDESADDLKHVDRVLARQLLHEKLEKQGAVLDQTRPNHL